LQVEIPFRPAVAWSEYHRVEEDDSSEQEAASEEDEEDIGEEDEDDSDITRLADVRDITSMADVRELLPRLPLGPKWTADDRRRVEQNWRDDPSRESMLDVADNNDFFILY
jgi:hypothetical protein